MTDPNLPPVTRVEITTPITGSLSHSISRIGASPDMLLWHVIRKSTEALSFNRYKDFVDFVLCGDTDVASSLSDPEWRKLAERWRNRYAELKHKRYLPFNDTDAYRLLKAATEAFLLVNCGICLDYKEYDYATSSDMLNELGKEFEQKVPALEAELSVDIPSDLMAWLDGYWKRYQLSVNGACSTVVPYLKLIQEKLTGVSLATTIFDEGWGTSSETHDSNTEDCYALVRGKLHMPCFIELIWSYWHEQGMLVQTMNAISRRFQNARGPGERDPLANMELDPLRPLNNLLWGYVQDEQHRLSIVRRAYEYDHHYGLRLEGKAIPPMHPADSRSRFLESFHTLLAQTAAFYRQADDTTMRPDPFPMLNVLRDLHQVLSEGAHNQFGDLPTTARIEMLMQQWLLARPEFREALPTRVMVAYPEAWMDRVDAMKRLQGWMDTSIMHFRNLARYGEELLLSVRFGNWSDVDDPISADTWARFFRSRIQGYIHAYLAVTGVDIRAATQLRTPQERSVLLTQPSVLLSRRASNGHRPGELAVEGQGVTGFRDRRAARQGKR